MARWHRSNSKMYRGCAWTSPLGFHSSKVVIHHTRPFLWTRPWLGPCFYVRMGPISKTVEVQTLQKAGGWEPFAMLETSKGNRKAHQRKTALEMEQHQMEQHQMVLEWSTSKWCWSLWSVEGRSTNSEPCTRSMATRMEHRQELHSWWWEPGTLIRTILVLYSQAMGFIQSENRWSHLAQIAVWWMILGSATCYSAKVSYHGWWQDPTQVDGDKSTSWNQVGSEDCESDEWQFWFWGSATCYIGKVSYHEWWQDPTKVDGDKTRCGVWLSFNTLLDTVFEKMLGMHCIVLILLEMLFRFMLEIGFWSLFMFSRQLGPCHDVMTAVTRLT